MPGGAQNCNSLTIWPKRFSRLYAFWPTNIWAGSLCTITMFSPRKLPQSSHPVVNRTQLTYSPRPPTWVWCRLWKRGGRSETTVPPASPSGCKCSRTAHNWRRWRSVSGSDQTNSAPACSRWFCDCTTGNTTTGKWENTSKCYPWPRHVPGNLECAVTTLHLLHRTVKFIEGAYLKSMMSRRNHDIFGLDLFLTDSTFLVAVTGQPANHKKCHKCHVSSSTLRLQKVLRLSVLYWSYLRFKFVGWHFWIWVSRLKLMS